MERGIKTRRGEEEKEERGSCVKRGVSGLVRKVSQKVSSSKGKIDKIFFFEDELFVQNHREEEEVDVVDQEVEKAAENRKGGEIISGNQDLLSS